jgi:predicted ester cyclase
MPGGRDTECHSATAKDDIVRRQEHGMTHVNEMVVRRFVQEIVGRGRHDLLPELVAADYVAHLPLGDHYGWEGVRIDVAEWHRGFHDLIAVVEDLLADGDRVVRRFILHGTHHGTFLGLAPTGRSVAVPGIAIDQLANGRLVESWVLVDLYDLARQLDTRFGPRPSLAQTAS